MRLHRALSVPAAGLLNHVLFLFIFQPEFVLLFFLNLSNLRGLHLSSLGISLLLEFFENDLYVFVVLWGPIHDNIELLIEFMELNFQLAHGLNVVHSIVNFDPRDIEHLRHLAGRLLDLRFVSADLSHQLDQHSARPLNHLPLEHN